MGGGRWEVGGGERGRQGEAGRRGDRERGRGRGRERGRGRGREKGRQGEAGRGGEGEAGRRGGRERQGEGEAGRGRERGRGRGREKGRQGEAGRGGGRERQGEGEAGGGGGEGRGRHQVSPLRCSCLGSLAATKAHPLPRSGTALEKRSAFGWGEGPRRQAAPKAGAPGGGRPTPGVRGWLGSAASAPTAGESSSFGPCTWLLWPGEGGGGANGKRSFWLRIFGHPHCGFPEINNPREWARKRAQLGLEMDR